jgi:hypothetical protein
MDPYQPPLYGHALNQDELDRMLLWRRQRTQRAAYRSLVQQSLLGSQTARMMLRDKFQPWADYFLDRSLPAQPDDPETEPISNQDLNW